MNKILILRPQPGADETAARAAELALSPVIAPLFTVRSCNWPAPDAHGYDAVMVTSTNALRLAGDAVRFLRGLPCYAVGERTAAQARHVGFSDVRAGTGDAQSLVAMMARDGIAKAIHLCGRDHTDASHPAVTVDRVAVYAAEAASRLPAHAIDAVRAGAIVMLHSPRAARLFGDLVDQARLDRGKIALAAISDAASRAAGKGWAAARVADAPNDQALLEVTAQLCQTRSSGTEPGDGL